MALARLILLTLALAIAPIAASAAPDGIYVAVENGGLEYLSLTSIGRSEITGYLQSFLYAPAMPDGLQRLRRDLTGTADGGRIVLQVAPGWTGGQALTGTVGWSSITLQFALRDGSIGQLTLVAIRT
jgi:hypothetical protein